MTGKLAGRRAIVTGAASGIGAATVKRLRADGAEVIAVDRAGVDVNVDLATDQGISAVIAAAGDRLDILINNAGICSVAPLAELDDAAWHNGLDVNVTAPFKLARALAPLLAKSQAERIINTGSIMSSYIALAPPIETFRKGRDFAAWLGLAPRQHSTGGKQRLGSISKMGERTIDGCLSSAAARWSAAPVATMRLQARGWSG